MAEGVPKYITVRENLRQRIISMDPGEKLPAEPELCKQYNVSRITLRHAIDDLIQDDLIEREQGKGTFRTGADANTEREVISDHIRGFFRQQEDLGNVVRTKVLSNTTVVDSGAAKNLGVDKNEPLVRLERLRYVGNTLKQHVVTFLSASRFSKVLEHDFSEGSLYEFLERQYAVHMVENEVVVRIQNADADMAEVFEVPEGAPLLAMDSVVVDEFGTIIAFGVALHTQEQGEIKFIIRSQKDVGPVQN